MHTKNLYENGPNPFFFFGTKNMSEGHLMHTVLVCYVFDKLGQACLSMRVRYSNEIAEWKWLPFFQNERVRYARKSRRAGPLQ